MRGAALSRVIAGAGLVGTLAACPAPTTQDPPKDIAPGYDQAAMRAAIADQVIVPTLEAFVTHATALETASAAYAAAPDDDDRRATAQDAFLDAMKTWQRLEVMQLGPASATLAGGKALRDEIYSFPSVNACAVDQQLVEGSYTSSTFTAQKLPNVYGLDAIEYLLFVEGSANACAGPATINTDGSWAALGEENVPRLRAAYAAAIADDVAASARALRDEWTGGFRDAFAAATSPYANKSDALDELYASIFYVEVTSKDRKIAVPAGLHVDCASDVCPNLLESPWAHRSKEYLVENLEGVRLLFTAGDTEGLGLKDLLIAANGETAATRVLEGLDVAKSALVSFEGSFADALLTDPERVRSLFTAFKSATDPIKDEVPMVLSVDIPDEGAGDND